MVVSNIGHVQTGQAQSFVQQFQQSLDNQSTVADDSVVLNGAAFRWDVWGQDDWNQILNLAFFDAVSVDHELAVSLSEQLGISSQKTSTDVIHAVHAAFLPYARASTLHPRVLATIEASMVMHQIMAQKLPILDVQAFEGVTMLNQYQSGLCWPTTDGWKQLCLDDDLSTTMAVNAFDRLELLGVFGSVDVYPNGTRMGQSLHVIDSEHVRVAKTVTDIFGASVDGRSVADIFDGIHAYMQTVSYVAEETHEWQSLDAIFETNGGDCEDLAHLEVSLLTRALTLAGHSDVANSLQVVAGYIGPTQMGHSVIQFSYMGNTYMLDPTLADGMIRRDAYVAVFGWRDAVAYGVQSTDDVLRVARAIETHADIHINFSTGDFTAGVNTFLDQLGLGTMNGSGSMTMTNFTKYAHDHYREVTRNGDAADPDSFTRSLDGAAVDNEAFWGLEYESPTASSGDYVSEDDSSNTNPEIGFDDPILVSNAVTHYNVHTGLARAVQSVNFRRLEMTAPLSSENMSQYVGQTYSGYFVYDYSRINRDFTALLNQIQLTNVLISVQVSIIEMIGKVGAILADEGVPSTVAKDAKKLYGYVSRPFNKMVEEVNYFAQQFTQTYDDINTAIKNEYLQEIDNEYLDFGKAIKDVFELGSQTIEQNRLKERALAEYFYAVNKNYEGFRNAWVELPYDRLLTESLRETANPFDNHEPAIAAFLQELEYHVVTETPVTVMVGTNVYTVHPLLYYYCHSLKKDGKVLDPINDTIQVSGDSHQLGLHVIQTDLDNRLAAMGVSWSSLDDNGGIAVDGDQNDGYSINNTNINDPDSINNTNIKTQTLYTELYKKSANYQRVIEMELYAAGYGDISADSALALGDLSGDEQYTKSALALGDLSGDEQYTKEDAWSLHPLDHTKAFVNITTNQRKKRVNPLDFLSIDDSYDNAKGYWNDLKKNGYIDAYGTYTDKLRHCLINHQTLDLTDDTSEAEKIKTVLASIVSIENDMMEQTQSNFKQLALGVRQPVDAEGFGYGGIADSGDYQFLNDRLDGDGAITAGTSLTDIFDEVEANIDIVESASFNNETLIDWTYLDTLNASMFDIQAVDNDGNPLTTIGDIRRYINENLDHYSAVIDANSFTTGTITDEQSSSMYTLLQDNQVLNRDGSINSDGYSASSLDYIDDAYRPHVVFILNQTKALIQFVFSDGIIITEDDQRAYLEQTLAELPSGSVRQTGYYGATDTDTNGNGKIDGDEVADNTFYFLFDSDGESLNRSEYQYDSINHCFYHLEHTYLFDSMDSNGQYTYKNGGNTITATFWQIPNFLNQIGHSDTTVDPPQLLPEIESQPDTAYNLPQASLGYTYDYGLSRAIATDSRVVTADSQGDYSSLGPTVIGDIEFYDEAIDFNDNDELLGPPNTRVYTNAPLSGVPHEVLQHARELHALDVELAPVASYNDQTRVFTLDEFVTKNSGTYTFDRIERDDDVGSFDRDELELVLNALERHNILHPTFLRLGNEAWTDGGAYLGKNSELEDTQYIRTGFTAGLGLANSTDTFSITDEDNNELFTVKIDSLMDYLKTESKDNWKNQTRDAMAPYFKNVETIGQTPGQFLVNIAKKSDGGTDIYGIGPRPFLGLDWRLFQSAHLGMTQVHTNVRLYFDVNLAYVAMIQLVARQLDGAATTDTKAIESDMQLYDMRVGKQRERHSLLVASTRQVMAANNDFYIQQIESIKASDTIKRVFEGIHLYGNLAGAAVFLVSIFMSGPSLLNNKATWEVCTLPTDPFRAVLCGARWAGRTVQAAAIGIMTVANVANLLKMTREAHVEQELPQLKREDLLSLGATNTPLDEFKRLFQGKTAIDNQFIRDNQASKWVSWEPEEDTSNWDGIDRVNDELYEDGLAKIYETYTTTDPGNGYTYQPDPTGSDLWQKATETVVKKGGDCEDMAILAASRAIGMGIPPERLRIMAGYLNGDKTQGHTVLVYDKSQAFNDYTGIQVIDLVNQRKEKSNFYTLEDYTQGRAGLTFTPVYSFNYRDDDSEDIQWLGSPFDLYAYQSADDLFAQLPSRKPEDSIMQPKGPLNEIVVEKNGVTYTFDQTNRHTVLTKTYTDAAGDSQTESETLDGKIPYGVRTYTTMDPTNSSTEVLNLESNYDPDLNPATGELSTNALLDQFGKTGIDFVDGLIGGMADLVLDEDVPNIETTSASKDWQSAAILPRAAGPAGGMVSTGAASVGFKSDFATILRMEFEESAYMKDLYSLGEEGNMININTYPLGKKGTYYVIDWERAMTIQDRLFQLELRMKHVFASIQMKIDVIRMVAARLNDRETQASQSSATAIFNDRFNRVKDSTEMIVSVLNDQGDMIAQNYTVKQQRWSKWADVLAQSIVEFIVNRLSKAAPYMENLGLLFADIARPILTMIGNIVKFFSTPFGAFYTQSPDEMRKERPAIQFPSVDDLYDGVNEVQTGSDYERIQKSDTSNVLYNKAKTPYNDDDSGGFLHANMLDIRNDHTYSLTVSDLESIHGLTYVGPTISDEGKLTWGSASPSAFEYDLLRHATRRYFPESGDDLLFLNNDAYQAAGIMDFSNQEYLESMQTWVAMISIAQILYVLIAAFYRNIAASLGLKGTHMPQSESSMNEWVGEFAKHCLTVFRSINAWETTQITVQNNRFAQYKELDQHILQGIISLGAAAIGGGLVARGNTMSVVGVATAVVALSDVITDVIYTGLDANEENAVRNPNSDEQGKQRTKESGSDYGRVEVVDYIAFAKLERMLQQTIKKLEVLSDMNEQEAAVFRQIAQSLGFDGSGVSFSRIISALIGFMNQSEKMKIAEKRLVAQKIAERKNAIYSAHRRATNAGVLLAVRVLLTIGTRMLKSGKDDVSEGIVEIAQQLLTLLLNSVALGVQSGLNINEGNQVLTQRKEREKKVRQGYGGHSDDSIGGNAVSTNTADTHNSHVSGMENRALMSMWFTAATHGKNQMNRAIQEMIQFVKQAVKTVWLDISALIKQVFDRIRSGIRNGEFDSVEKNDLVETNSSDRSPGRDMPNDERSVVSPFLAGIDRGIEWFGQTVAWMAPGLRSRKERDFHDEMSGLDSNELSKVADDPTTNETLNANKPQEGFFKPLEGRFFKWLDTPSSAKGLNGIKSVIKPFVMAFSESFFNRFLGELYQSSKDDGIKGLVGIDQAYLNASRPHIQAAAKVELKRRMKHAIEQDQPFTEMGVTVMKAHADILAKVLREQSVRENGWKKTNRVIQGIFRHALDISSNGSLQPPASIQSGNGSLQPPASIQSGNGSLQPPASIQSGNGQTEYRALAIQLVLNLANDGRPVSMAQTMQNLLIVAEDDKENGQAAVIGFLSDLSEQGISIEPIKARDPIDESLKSPEPIKARDPIDGSLKSPEPIKASDDAGKKKITSGALIASDLLGAYGNYSKMRQLVTHGAREFEAKNIGVEKIGKYKSRINRRLNNILKGVIHYEEGINSRENTFGQRMLKLFHANEKMARETISTEEMAGDKKPISTLGDILIRGRQAKQGINMRGRGIPKHLKKALDYNRLRYSSLGQLQQFAQTKEKEGIDRDQELAVKGIDRVIQELAAKGLNYDNERPNETRNPLASPSPIAQKKEIESAAGTQATAVAPSAQISQLTSTQPGSDPSSKSIDRITGLPLEPIKQVVPGELSPSSRDHGSNPQRQDSVGEEGNGANSEEDKKPIQDSDGAHLQRLEPIQDSLETEARREASVIPYPGLDGANSEQSLKSALLRIIPDPVRYGADSEEGFVDHSDNSNEETSVAETIQRIVRQPRANKPVHVPRKLA